MGHLSRGSRRHVGRWAPHVGRWALASSVSLIASLFVAGTVLAHPLGNFTINQYDGLRVSRDAVMIDHVTDMAEIPTFAERRSMDTDGDGRISAAEMESYEQGACRSVGAALHLEVGDRPAALGLRETGLSFPQGQGAPTLRLVCVFAAPLVGSPAGMTVRFRDTWHAERIGWREIVVEGDGLAVTGSSAPPVGTTERLTRYPDDPLAQPLAMQSVEFSVSGAGPALPAFDAPDADTVAAPVVEPGGAGAPGSAGGPAPAGPEPVDSTPSGAAAVPGGIGEIGTQLTEIIQTEDLTGPVLVVSLLVAAGLGALHALSPGHGKTVMAAYLVGSRGTARQALGLGLTVTVAHTAGVLALGLITLSAGAFMPPERLYPVLGLVSGLLVVGIGLYLVLGRVRAWQAERQHAALHGHDHDHEHPHNSTAYPQRHEAEGPPHVGIHQHHHEVRALHEDLHRHRDDGLDHPHEVAGRSHEPVDVASETDGWHSHGLRRHSHLPSSDPGLRWRGLFALGLSGGMVPSVSALILLLGSVSFGRPAYGILLTVAFGVGMAVVLVGVGIALVYARGLLDRLPARTRAARVTALLPIATAVVVLLAGGSITVQAVLTLV